MSDPTTHDTKAPYPAANPAADFDSAQAQNNSRVHQTAIANLASKIAGAMFVNPGPWLEKIDSGALLHELQRRGCKIVTQLPTQEILKDVTST